MKMRSFFNWLATGLMLCIIFLSCKKEKNDAAGTAIIVSASGNITASVSEFRDLLGATLNTTPGHISGRREINWDAVPDIYENESIPPDFFNPVAPGSLPGLQRGFHYSPVLDARISNSDFAGLDSSNALEFSSFSGNKTFSAVSTNLWNVDFQVPGQAIAASVKGFAAVFSDVDDPHSTTIEYFSGSKSLGIYKVPVRSAGSLSFLGVYFPNEKITTVRIKQGNAVLAGGVKDISAGGSNDLVIMDDFFYDEPQGL
jgi:hypothetical protein